MQFQQLLVPLGVGLIVWVATFVPFRRMLSATVETRAGLLAAGLSAMLGATALIAWEQVAWYRYGVLAICAGFGLMYVTLVSFERMGQLSA